MYVKNHIRREELGLRIKRHGERRSTTYVVSKCVFCKSIRYKSAVKCDEMRHGGPSGTAGISVGACTLPAIPLAVGRLVQF